MCQAVYSRRRSNQYVNQELDHISNAVALLSVMVSHHTLQAYETQDTATFWDETGSHVDKRCNSHHSQLEIMNQKGKNFATRRYSHRRAHGNH